MSDYAKLKELALAAPTGPWYAPDESDHKGTVFDCDLGSLLCYESIESEQEACVAYVAASNPAVVLGLIAENERYRQYGCDTCDGSGHLHSIDGEYFGECKSCGAYDLEQARRERDQLKAECDGLRRKVRIQQRLNESAESIRKDAGGQS